MKVSRSIKEWRGRGLGRREVGVTVKERRGVGD